MDGPVLQIQPTIEESNLPLVRDLMDELVQQCARPISISFPFASEIPSKTFKNTCNFNIRGEQIKQDEIKNIEERIYEITNLKTRVVLKKGSKRDYLHVIASNTEEADRLRNMSAIGYKNWLFTPG